MTTEQRRLCGALTIFPNGQKPISKEEFLRQFPIALDNGKLALNWVEEATQTKSSEDLDCALLIGFTFGFAPLQKDILCRLIKEDWHGRHEDVVSALQNWPGTDTLEALFSATQWIPKALEYDDFRALAVKAIWAIGKIPGAEAEAKLELLKHSDNAILRKNAIEQLERRRQSN